MSHTDRPALVRPGDKIRCMKMVVEIGKTIHYQDCYWEVTEDHPEGAWYWDIEFVDSQGMYRHWKQMFDGGELIRA